MLYKWNWKVLKAGIDWTPLWRCVNAVANSKIKRGFTVTAYLWYLLWSYHVHSSYMLSMLSIKTLTNANTIRLYSNWIFILFPLLGNYGTLWSNFISNLICRETSKDFNIGFHLYKKLCNIRWHSLQMSLPKLIYTSNFHRCFFIQYESFQNCQMNL